MCQRAGHPGSAIVIAQARPGQFAHAAVNELESRPAADAASGPPGQLLRRGNRAAGNRGPACVRVYWHQWLARVLASCRAATSPTTWQLPKTSSDAERVDFACAIDRRQATGRLAILHATGQTFDVLGPRLPDRRLRDVSGSPTKAADAWTDSRPSSGTAEDRSWRSGTAQSSPTRFPRHPRRRVVRFSAARPGSAGHGVRRWPPFVRCLFCYPTCGHTLRSITPS